jgi:5-methyltetrahydropteroyltriglutamate--homocysteine methyltransferase
MLLPTTLVGSYPQPDWLIDREALLRQRVPRIRMPQLWRVPPQWLALAQDDATVLAIREQERAGLDIVTDGEIRRESYSNRFANALEGLALDPPGFVPSRTGAPTPVPRVIGPIRRRRPVEVEDLKFLRAHTDRRVKITLPGPFTMSQQALDEHYGDPRRLALAYAEAVNGEVRDLFAAGADIVQLDEPYMQAAPERARAFGVEALDRALDGVTGTTCVHLCFGYAALVKERPSGYSFLPELAHARCAQVSIETAQSGLDCSVLRQLPGKTILVGVIDLADGSVEPAQTVAARIRCALEHVPAERVVVAPDCGMKYLPRDVAAGKLRALVDGARLVRKELGAG